MNDYLTTEPVEGWQLELGDRIVTVDSDDETHHIEIGDFYDENTAVRGQGYCQDHDQDCYFIVGAFEEVTLWNWNQD